MTGRTETDAYRTEERNHGLRDRCRIAGLVDNGRDKGAEIIPRVTFPYRDAPAPHCAQRLRGIVLTGKN